MNIGTKYSSLGGRSLKNVERPFDVGPWKHTRMGWNFFFFSK